jgi:uncharacterized protein (TIGR03437 family)
MCRQIKIRTARVVVLGAAAAILAWAYYYGPPAGVTTAPTDLPGIACTYCHVGTALNGGGGSTKIQFPNGLTYVPGQTETLTIITNDSQAYYYGFQLTARLESSGDTTQAGNLIAGSGQAVVCSDGSASAQGPCNTSDKLQWVEHFQQPISSNQIPVQWTAPPAGSGNVHIYVAVNAANGDGTVYGDHIYAADYVLTPAAAPNLPVINPGGIVNSASGSTTIQSGSFVTIYGKQFASAATNWSGSIVNGVFPTTLAGISVSINGKPAAISFVNSSQINVLTPADTASGTVSVTVKNANGTSAASTVTLAAESPAFFTFSQGGGKYIAAQIALPNSGVELLGPAGLFGSSVASRPARPGEIILLYGTGFGPTNPTVDPSKVFSGAAPTKDPVSVTIGGQPANVLFAGLSGAGLYQINVAVPAVPAGDQPVTASVNGVPVTQSVYVTVGN